MKMYANSVEEHRCYENNTFLIYTLFVFIPINHGFRPHPSVSFSAHEEIRVTDNSRPSIITLCDFFLFVERR